MPVRRGAGHARVQQPGVQLLEAPHPQPRREEPLADEADLVLDLALRPAGRRVQGRSLGAMGPSPRDGGSTRKWLHICEASGGCTSTLAGEDRLHRRLRSAADRPLGSVSASLSWMPRVQAPLKKAKARSWASNIEPSRRHRSEPDGEAPASRACRRRTSGCGRAGRGRFPVTVTPQVSTTSWLPSSRSGLARRVAEPDVGLGRHRPAALRPGAGITADGVRAALAAGGAQVFVDPGSA